MRSAAPVMRDFADAQAQAQALAGEVATQLQSAIAVRGNAWLAVPGGNTPQAFLAALARQDLDWPRVSVTLTDERQVPVDDARSNARRLRDALLDRVPARFLPLVDAHGTMIDAVTVQALPRRFDAVVLGMGADGHCASLFADADAVEAALDPAARDAVLRLRSPGVPESRVTLTLRALVATRALYVLIQDAEKRRVLERALHADAGGNSLPIGRVLASATVVPQIFWCP